jgi:ubiquinone/menaquinone biosynthesis C-methylase UbiE
MTSNTNKGKSTIELFDSFAVEYQDRYMNVDLYRQSLDQFCDLITDGNADILDLACGPGNITRFLLNRRPGFSVLGIDLATNMLKLAKANNPEAHFIKMDVRAMTGLERQFDGILCGFCLPYLSKKEAIQLIGQAYQHLKPDGILYLSTMEGDPGTSGFQAPSSGGLERMYIQYHEAGYLRRALKRNGFTELALERLSHNSEEGIQTTDLILIAKK